MIRVGLFDKLKDILFDEETVEIPVITKETSEPKKTQKIEVAKNTEEVVIQKIDKVKDDEDLFDMPKLKEEAREEVKTNSFTFPFFDDEEPEVKEMSRTKKKEDSKPKDESRNKRGFDYLSSTSYKPKEDNSSKSASRLSQISTNEPKKPFTISPIISPVYGILNENYKKEDISVKTDALNTRLSAEKVDLDSVRKKAYGSLEEGIDDNLAKKSSKNIESDILDEVPTEEELDFSDDGLSIDDLLIDKGEELFKMEDLDADIDLTIDDDGQGDEHEAIGEEDLFDLIDSLYAKKG